MPSRKRSKRNEPVNDHDRQQDSSTATTATPASRQAPSASNHTDASPEMKKSRSWYGTWPRTGKSTASTELARESASAAKPTNLSSADLSRFEAKKAERPSPSASRPPSMYLGKSKETSSVTTSEATVDDIADDRNSAGRKGDQPPNTRDKENSDLKVKTGNEERPAASTGFLSYIPIVNRWGYPQPPPESENPDQGERNSDVKNSSETSNATNLDGANDSKLSEESDNSWSWMWSAANRVPRETSAVRSEPVEELAPPIVSDNNKSKGSSNRSWWPRSTNSVESGTQEIGKTNERINRTPANPAAEDIPTFQDGSQPAPGSSWTFFNKTWSGESVSQSENGELAVIGDKSQNRPEPATMKSSRTTKDASAVTPSTASSVVKTPPQHFPLKNNQIHILIPELRETYKLMEDPSIMQQIARLIRLTREPAAECVSLIRNPPKIKKAVVIGVHGLLPEGIFQLISPPATGTSELFATACASAILRWTRSHDYICTISRVRIEFGGAMAVRIQHLFGALLNHIAEIKTADLVMFSCHSQGVPLGIILAAKLVDLGVIPSTTKIGICAMAGVNLGPLRWLDNRLTRALIYGYHGFELFDLADSETELSKLYLESLRKIIRFGAKITYTGSIDDQVVSMESSVFTPVHHPHIYRAVLADGRYLKPDFIVRLVGFALKLRNLGVKDHGLIKDLSPALTGDLTGQGHSVIYDYSKVYDLSVQHTLETSSVSDVELEVHPYNGREKTDPFFLPFAIRGVLDEELVKTELSNEVEELLQQFDQWQPTTKGLQEVKQKLRVIKSRL